MKPAGLYGVLAEFATADGLLAAAREAHREGHFVEAYSPFAIEGLSDAIGFTRNRMPFVTFVGGLLGGVGAYALQWYSAVVDYPINAGGRPLDSWPAFVPAVFAVTLLGAALAAVVGMLAANGLPCLRHPLFEIREFDLATRNRFFLCLRPGPVGFDVGDARAFLEAQQAMKVWEVPQ
ncbi:MAG TPA: DUF3341 domain-containing protein [Aromatoleum sp.]|uniref:DUF3341 domain-containing protein n=1 Tax=Aromatoleum sp. TaxID=2307007 RepID=UPI002B47AD06|nr:DUF3341 domain-containing protein [Aromatoleum sp.]HJV26908.1 DUF3341 domain-containing protein [Aromatoleum sp.]